MRFVALKLLSLAALLALTLGQDEPVLEVHGSGTTNPSKCYWLIMDQIMDRAKAAIRLTYRAVGSSTGQAEFISNENDFGSGDIPISTEDYDALQNDGVGIVHLPIVLGAISLFHSVPNIAHEEGRGLNLTACVIARIFKREITTWDHQDVKDLNPNLDLPSENYAINVAHRVHGSSSTASVTQYLHQTCPDEWPEELVGKTIEWPEDTEGCEGSGGMTDCILETEGTIGYIDAGHGHDENLQEIELQNADGTYLTSKEAKEKGGIGAAATAVPESADLDFGAVNLLNQPGPNTWPIVAMSYVYVRKDLSHLDLAQEQALLKAFLTALYDPAYIGQCEEEFAFTRVPDEVKAIGLAGIDMLEVNNNATDFIFENSTLVGEGQGLYVISEKRRTFAEYQRSALMGDVAHLKDVIQGLRKEIAKMEGELKSVQGEVAVLRQQMDTGGGTRVASQQEAVYTEEDDSQLKASLVMSSLSMVLWGLTIGFVVFRHITRKGVSSSNKRGGEDGVGADTYTPAASVGAQAYPPAATMEHGTA